MSISLVEPPPPITPPAIDPFGLEAIRAAVYGPEHLEQHAHRLAAAATVEPGRAAGPLPGRFQHVARSLVRSHRWIANLYGQRQTIGPDAEWLLDNFHIVGDAIREVRTDLPRGYHAELPKLATGPLAGFPRVYALALELIAHADSSLDESNITHFVQAYQTVVPLSIGELWAVPIMLRAGLLENLHRLARQMMDIWQERACIQALAERFKQAEPGASLPAFDKLVRPHWLGSDPCIVHLLQLFRDHGAPGAGGVEWLESHLGRRQVNAAEVLRREHQRQAANQVSIGNSITSMRLLSALDWTVFFERTSLVEAILCDDPAGVYARQDFASRDRYRRAVEKLARGAQTDELDVARRTLLLAGRHRTVRSNPQTEASPNGAPAPHAALPRLAHVGYYLVDRGQDELEAELGCRPSLPQRLLRTILGHPLTVYFAGLATVALLVLAGLLSGAGGLAVGWPILVLLLLAALLPASEAAVGLVNYLVTMLLPPRVLAKLDFQEFIPADCATFVVMPSMLIRPESAAILLGRLEVHFLSNADSHLSFALLTDFADAPAEHRPEDAEYLREALERVRALNQRYAGDGPPRFFLFHRKRLWNPVEERWMGWERKRGKLGEFNRLLRGARDTSFTTLSTPPDQLPYIRFVITLDADTRLPRETARRLIGTLAHPLNQARFDPAQGRVVEGYAVLQPRVSFRITLGEQSLFARIFTGSAGIDPYVTAVSDVYQDLFGSGNYTGKGIYDVDAFEAAVGHTFPDNHILSHDLIEGNYARCGLVTDIELLDDFPARYHAHARRDHRWTRGDWQLLPWLFPQVPHADGGTRKNPLPALERWKVADNLRRSLVPPALVVLLLLGWLLVPAAAWLWTGFALIVLALPLLLQVFGGLVQTVRGFPSLASLRGLQADLPCTAVQVVLAAVFLADQARTQADAIVRTLYRLLASRRNLLEWETAASTERRLGTDFTAFVLNMWPAPALALALALIVSLVQPHALPAAAPFLAGWLVSPAIAYWVSRPRTAAEPPLTGDERQALRRVARKTWGFFETFVGDEDHWLPPDNFQEDPKGEVAHRTSPTNQGLLLLSTLAAHDLGYLSLPTMLGRLEKSFDTLDRLERHQGHFFNWYDTRTLHPLQQGYVSTVDSGNLMGCLLALKQGLREKIEERVPGPAFRDGLADTWRLLGEELRLLEKGTPTQGKGMPLDALAHFHRDLGRLLEENPSDLAQWDVWLKRCQQRSADLIAQGESLAQLLAEAPDELLRWARRLAKQVRDRRDEIDGLYPWVPWFRQRGADRPDAGLAPDQRWQSWLRTLLKPVSIGHVNDQGDILLAELAELKKSSPAGADPVPGLEEAIRASTAADSLARCQWLADRAHALATEMDFRFLYNEHRHLFATGYSVATGRLDNSHYDLLASEARLASFLAIARGHAEKRHWFQLGRAVTRAGDTTVLLSWGGTMFEYLMPQLLLHGYPGTLLEESCRGAVQRQIEYGRQCRVPWGISESAFGALDGQLDYQYQSFGVPGLGLKRGLAQDLVIAPYASALAAGVRPHAVLANFAHLASEGGEGAYGFYEAIDYTRDRLEKKRQSLVVRCYMAHHQAMALVALANGVLGNPMPRRFHREPMIRATEMLLQERVPRAAPIVEPNQDERIIPPTSGSEPQAVRRRLTTAQTPTPRTHLLSSGRYCVMITNAGGGYSTCRGLDVTRWREDRTRDGWGQFCYIHDLRRGLLWSAGHQPVGRLADAYEVFYSPDKAEFRRSDAGIETRCEIAVSPEQPAEIRRVTLTNHDSRAHDLELTSYAEVVLAPHGGDLAHPAFGKLFVETEFVSGPDALLARRRPRAEDQQPVWAVHVLAVEGPALGRPQYETDRVRFLGRGRTTTAPAALDRGAVLSGTTGPVLDPIFSLRQRLRVAPGATVSVTFTTAVADSRDEALALADQFRDPHAGTRAFELAWAHSQVELRHLRLSAADAHLYQRLAASVLYSGATLRADPAVLTANRQGQPSLWRHGISGDRPIVLACVAEENELSLVRQLLAAHSYWRLKGLEVDLVVLNEHPTSYFEEVHQQLQGLVRTSDAHNLVDKPGGVFVRKSAHLTEEDKILLQAAARVVVKGYQGTLAAQVDRLERPPTWPGRLAGTGRPDKRLARRERRQARKPDITDPRAELLFANGRGGFTPDGQEYRIFLDRSALSSEGDGQPSPEQATEGTPTPWINVVANPVCGFLVSESGGGYTWAGNSQTNRLTPWQNDPAADAPGEAVYLRDEVTGEYWTPTPLPRGEGQSCVCRHGQGYTVFERRDHGLVQELLLFVPPEDPIKVLRLTVRNDGSTVRQLSATFYAEWVLGTVRDQAAQNVVTEIDSATGALLARNAFNTDFASRLAFAEVNARPRTLTADRTEFLGRNGSPAAPAALGRVALTGRVEAALDPCAALQAPFTLSPGESREIVFLLGQAASIEDVRRLVQHYREAGRVQKAWEAARAGWERILGTIQVHTPDPALDLLLNRWLLYQVLSCRVWGRSALYQSGGAYGFRDQLQDVMALVHGAPDETRSHILRAASHQFVEGDVQHWWHPPSGRGVRTRFCDDFLWLPLVVCHYVAATGDATVLDQRVPYLKSPPLKPDQEEDYGLPETSAETGTVYEHSARALDHGWRLGAHGLPLMGTGDWNDGMNRVGSGGKGESVWNAWFLVDILQRFAELAKMRGDADRAALCQQHADQLRAAVEEHAWDGRWYRRAYFDDGTPLGSAESDECKIDSIVQSWAVLSGAGDPARARQALAAVDEYLVRRDPRLILLFAPPFDKGRLHPGYIKGYVPGIRENGGQYTHAATWVVQALAMMGDGDRALELLDLLNPVRHATTPQEVDRYRVEPYVIAADVYSEPPHTGRGGWTWYTGSAGWYYRVALETILGFQRLGSTLHLEPCIAHTWALYTITYRFRSATYRITVENPDGVQRGVRRVEVDGREVEGGQIDLIDDGRTHPVRVLMGQDAASKA
jgi:cyclic beta-1,2-glucan synthetase